MHVPAHSSMAQARDLEKAMYYAESAIYVNEGKSGRVTDENSGHFQADYTPSGHFRLHLDMMWKNSLHDLEQNGTTLRGKN